MLNIQIILGSQYYFYMETQTALAIPDEDNSMVVYSAVQSPEFAQISIARCLGVPEHKVRVITRRLGGAFGGKCQRAMKVSVIIAPLSMFLCLNNVALSGSYSMCTCSSKTRPTGQKLHRPKR